MRLFLLSWYISHDCICDQPFSYTCVVTQVLPSIWAPNTGTNRLVVLSAEARTVRGAGSDGPRPRCRSDSSSVGMAMGTRNPMGKNPIRARVWRILIPMGILLSHLLCPSGTVGVGMFSLAPYPLPDGEPANIWHVGPDLYVSYKMNLLSLFANPKNQCYVLCDLKAWCCHLMLNIVEPVIKLCWVRYICYAGTYYCDSNDHVYHNVNGYEYDVILYHDG
jgi:hypothetical protein